MFPSPCQAHTQMSNLQQYFVRCGACGNRIIKKTLFGDQNGSLLRRQPRAVVVVSKLPVSGSTLQQPLKLAWPKPTACVAMVMSALLLR